MICCAIRFLPLLLLAVSAAANGDPGGAAWVIPPQDSATDGSQTLESRLKSQPVDELAARVMAHGDAARGALVYYNPVLTCVRCHEPSADAARLGPSLAEVNTDASLRQLIESVLDPSRQLTDGFQTETVLTIDGNQVTGLVAAADESASGFLVLVDPDQNGKSTRIAMEDIEERRTNEVSAMPAGLTGAMEDEQSFLDLMRYLVEIKRGGKKAVLQLRPPASFFAVAPLPEYESNIDHARLIRSLDEPGFHRGEAIYQRYCARCHGTREQEGSMPSALTFFDGAFKNGNDPHAMYRTLTHGYGLMVAQRWMVPRQKYDVIHYIREHFIKPSNREQYFLPDRDYLAALPAGTGTGPDPVERTPWSDMDYGNFLFNTLEVGNDGSNIAYKGIAIRLDDGPGGVSQGKHWILYEHDTMRVAATWSGSGFIDYNGIHFNDRHNVHPRIVGDVHVTNDHRPGWAHPLTGSFDDDPRVTGRDGKRYGPFPETWLKYRGLYQYDGRVVLDYTVGDTEIYESPALEFADQQPVVTRTLNIGPRQKPLLLRVASVQDLTPVDGGDRRAACFAVGGETRLNGAADEFDGTQYLRAAQTLEWQRDLTIVARVKTGQGGTLICQTTDQEEWVPGGHSLFIRNGRLVFDIGWVGAVTSRQRIDDDRWHTVALVWRPDRESVGLFIDGAADRQGTLAPDKTCENPVLRIGYTAGNFPQPQSALIGTMSRLKVWDRALTSEELATRKLSEVPDEGLIADWDFSASPGGQRAVPDRAGRNNHASRVVREAANPAVLKKNVWVAVQGLDAPEWQVVDESVCLSIPAGNAPLNLLVASGTAPARQALPESCKRFLASAGDGPVPDLRALMQGGPPRFPTTLKSTIETMPSTPRDPFVVDYLNGPRENPWSCRMRFTGIDFRHENTALVCSWDGSVWEVSGFLQGAELSWKRIASGLFQPLGIRVIDGRIHVTCRDQLVVLEDLNRDGFIDYYRAFNSDHQVTEHFHEFAMGLQSDDGGNFYYAKSARHALPALVPHHGTLLKVSGDGRSTEIVANGFRAANGVCLNPDGTFYVTDQEGHWTPKNRINRVRPGGFYGNMLGYHELEDDSDEAMEQPLCWITNAFDRSPGELLWIPADTWGSLGGSLLNLSYGMGQVFVVPRETVSLDGRQQLQGGMCALPIPLFPTGVMRGRFHSDGNLYCCGMYAWAGNQQQAGGLYRIRHTGQPEYLPRTISTARDRISIEFSNALDAASATERNRYAIRTWDIQRTANYGSPHLNEKELRITGVRLHQDGRTLELTVPGLQPVRCMEIRGLFLTPGGREVSRTIHNTIHALGQPAGQ